ncbi:hypothetical protein TNCV_2000471 [Trichonephila clavipes]|nr:hypothetical protein TNCV_2000471 [Trichonephila clavipes]
MTRGGLISLASMTLWKDFPALFKSSRPLVGLHTPLEGRLLQFEKHWATKKGDRAVCRSLGILSSLSRPASCLKVTRWLPGRNGRCTSGVYTPGRVTQGVKAIPVC